MTYIIYIINVEESNYSKLLFQNSWDKTYGDYNLPSFRTRHNQVNDNYTLQINNENKVSNKAIFKALVVVLIRIFHDNRI